MSYFRFVNVPPGSTLHFGIVAANDHFTALASDGKGEVWEKPDLLAPGVAYPIGIENILITMNITFTQTSQIAIVCWLVLPDGSLVTRDAKYLVGDLGSIGTIDIRVYPEEN